MAKDDTAQLFRAMGEGFRELSIAIEGKSDEDLVILPKPAASDAVLRYVESEKRLPPRDKRAFEEHRKTLAVRFNGDERLVLKWLPEACEELAQRVENGAPRMEAPLELLKRLMQ